MHVYFKITQLLILILFLSTGSLSAANFHVLLYGNRTEGNNRGCDRASDLNSMDSFFRRISDDLNYQYLSDINSAQYFTSEEALSDIFRLDVSENDVVVFYYTGHGYNEQVDEWPSLNFVDNNYHSTKLLTVLEKVAEDAKLILFITDCCNKPFTSPFISNENGYGSHGKNYYLANIRKLFRDFEGKKTIRMTASKNGQYSYSRVCGTGGDAGSYFGMCFRKVFNDLATNYRSVSWERIINESIEETRSVRGDQDPNGIVSNREERILEEVQLAEKSNIYIAYNGDQWNCNLPITITIADVKVKPMGRLFKATGVPSGRQRYTIQGIINCPAIGSCVVKGSGFIEVEENAKYYVVWKIISQGRCNAYLTR